MDACKVYVINIPTSTSRRESISSQLRSLQIPHEFFDAIDGRKKHHPLFDKYDETKRQKTKGKKLSGGQLGCYASHYLLWEKCLSLKKPIIVLEDDALIYGNYFSEFYHNSKNLDPKFECIRLFQNKSANKLYTTVTNFGTLAIAKFFRGHMSTTGYYLTPAAAKKYILDSTQWFLAVDIAMDRFWANKVECFGVIPACLNNDPKFQSDINYDQIQNKKSLITRVNRELHATNELLKRSFWNLKFIIRNFFS